MLFPLPIVLFACASHEIKALAPQPIGAYQLRETTADVTIAAEPLATKEKAEATFTVDLTEQGYAPILAETLPHPNISSRLLSVVRELESPGEGEMKTPHWRDALQTARVDQIGRLEVMIETTETTPQVLKELDARGSSIEIYDPAQNLVQAWVPPGKIGDVATLPFVKFIDLPNYGVTNRLRK